ncbi:MAG: Fic family protein [Bacteroidota bacterium]
MTLIETPPEWGYISSTRQEEFNGGLNTPEVQSFIRKANEEYLHWEKLKYLPMPEGIDPELAWSFVKLSRFMQAKPTEIKTPNGNRFKYWLPDSILRELHFIDQTAAGQILVEDPASVGSEKDRYVINALMEEAIASSILEGAATTHKRAKEMLRDGRKPVTRGEMMIQNNYLTMKEIKNRLRSELSIELLCEFQASITKNTLDDPTGSGRLRREDEDVRVYDQTDGAVLYTPPPAEELRTRLKKLCEFANTSSEDSFVHPVIKAIILHFWLAYEHPFVDGNGRTARTLLHWYLVKNKYRLIEYLPISRIILRAPSKYKMAFLYSEHDDEDLTYFIHFNIHALRLALDDLKKYVAEKQKEIAEARTIVKRLPGLNYRQQELIHHALHHPDAIYSIVRHKILHRVVYQTARTDLRQLVAKKLLRMGKSGRILLFYPVADLAKKMKTG